MSTLMQGFWKLASNSFLKSHEDYKLELQGAGQPLCSSTMQKKAQEYKPDILFLLETKLAKDKGQDIFKKVWILEWVGSPS